MTIEPTELDMIALARRGLEALYDEASTELRFARRLAANDAATGGVTAESAEARATALRAVEEATDRLLRFNVLYRPADAVEA